MVYTGFKDAGLHPYLEISAFNICLSKICKLWFYNLATKLSDDIQNFLLFINYIVSTRKKLNTYFSTPTPPADLHCEARICNV